jgi:fatty acid/phospholipid biosynthesis enzyme
MMHLGSERQKQEDPSRFCDVVLSAGNTGACVSAAIMHMKRLPYVHRRGSR